MNMKKALFLLFLFFTMIGFAQKKQMVKIKPIIASYDSIDHAEIVPDNLFSVNPDAMIIPRHYLSKKQDNPAFIFEIFWPAPYIDGDCKLTINQRQIVLTTGHENPNPNYLYWFTNISPLQFQNIVKKLNSSHNFFSSNNGRYRFNRQLHYKNFTPELPLPDKWTKKQLQIHNNDFEKKMYGNTLNLISIFNSDVSPNNQVKFPSFQDFKKHKPILTAMSADELSWIKRSRR